MTVFVRSGGRAADQLRLVRITRGYTIHAEGSVLIEFGQTRGVSTDSISDGVFASTIQAGMPSDSELDDLDEDAIERSIAEINEAIKRSSAARKP